MKGWNPKRRREADERRDVERATVLAELRRRDTTARALARRAGLSLFQVRRALKRLRRERLVTWLPQRGGLPKHAYTRVYVASSRVRRRVSA